MNKVVVITGGNSGIGEACARRFAREGYEVIVCSRREAKNQELCESLRETGARAHGYAVDMRDPVALNAVFQQISVNHPPVDCLINSMGIEGSSFTLTEDYADDIFDDVMATNVKAPWLCMKAVLPRMRELGRGSIVNVASLAGLRASVTGGTAYTASKHALVGMTRAAAKEYAPFGVRVNAVCPGFVNTPMLEDIFGQELEQAASTYPLNRICEKEEVANVIYWLASDQASYVTGTAMPVDGGLVA